MITGSFQGGDRLVERIRNMPAAVRRALLEAVKRLTIELQAYVMESKLSGQVLHNRTGTLRRSIYQHLLESVTGVLGEVGTNLGYGVFWEYGGTIPAHDVVAKGRALAFTWNGNQVFFKRVHIPERHEAERSFLRTALADQASYIRETIIAAVRSAVRNTR